MISATKKNTELVAPTNEIQEARDKLKKVSSLNNGNLNYNKPLETNEAVQKEQQGERTLALISHNDNLDKIIHHIKQDGFTIINNKTIQFSLDQAKEFYVDHQSQTYYDKMVRWLSSGSNICALILGKENAIKDWKSLMGPANYKKARKSNPNSIRVLFGKDVSQNATHGSDSDASAKKEIDFIFGDSSFVQQQEITLPSSAAIEELPHNQKEQERNDIDPATVDDGDKNVVLPAESTSLGVSNSALETQNGIAKADDIVDYDTKSEINESDVSQVITPAASIKDEELEILDHKKVTEKVVATLAEKATLPENVVVVGNEVVVEDSSLSNQVILPEEATIAKESSLSEEAILQKEAILPENSNSKKEATLPENDVSTKEKTLDKEANLPENGVLQEKTPLDRELEKEENDAFQSNISTLIVNNDDFITKEDVKKEETTIKEVTSTPSNETDNVKVPFATQSTTTLDDKIQEGSKDNIETETPLVEETNPKLVKRDSVGNKAPHATKNTNSKDVKSETVVPLNSRIRPPSIRRGQNGNMIQSGEPIIGRVTTNKVISANSSNTITTRIARLSPSVTINGNESPIIEKKKITTAANATATKKPITKISKNLPRVAMMSTPKQPVVTKEDETETEKKTKKQLSSTKSFISRLTTPTVASSNKKADNDTAPTVTSGISRRATLSSKRSSKSNSSNNSKELPTRNKQKK